MRLLAENALRNQRGNHKRGVMLLALLLRYPTLEKHTRWTSADPKLPPTPGKVSPIPRAARPLTEPLRSPSPHLWHPPEPSLKTPQQGSCPRKHASQPGNRDVAQRGESQGRGGTAHRETRAPCFGGWGRAQGLGPSEEGRAALLRLARFVEQKSKVKVE